MQAELGTKRTPFEHRPYGIELALCQRYYCRISSPTVDGVLSVNSYAANSTTGVAAIPLPVPMRARPTSIETTGVNTDYVWIFGPVTSQIFPVYHSNTTEKVVVVGCTVSGLTAGSAGYLRQATANGFIGVSAEL